MNEARIRVIYGDTDQMGVVYYANYFRYFEAARNELFRDRGVSYRELEAEGLKLPVVDAQCSYKAPARYDDLLRIDTRVTLGRASITFDYELTRDADGARLAEGRTVHACLGSNDRVTPVPKALRSLIED